MGKKAELTGAIGDLTNRVHALRQSVDALRLAVLNNTLETHAARGQAKEEKPAANLGQRSAEFGEFLYDSGADFSPSQADVADVGGTESHIAGRLAHAAGILVEELLHVLLEHLFRHTLETHAARGRAKEEKPAAKKVT